MRRTGTRTPRHWTVDRLDAAYLEVAVYAGHTPRHGDLGQVLYQAMHSHGYTMGAMALRHGLIPHVPKRTPPPLPDGWCRAPEPPKPEPVDNGVDLAAEREMHLARMRVKYAKEPPRSRIRVPGMRQSMRQDFGERRLSFRDDYLPPPDLTVVYQRKAG